MLPKESIEKGGGMTSQYRTTLVADANTYRIYINAQGNSNQLINAVDAAILNYNNLNLGIRFVRITRLSYAAGRRHIAGVAIGVDYDLLIKTVDLPGRTVGRGGFPLRIRKSAPPRAVSEYLNVPYRLIQIDPDASDLTADVFEHVMTHEIGHCIGLRHTDFFNRRLSCIVPPGENPNEGQSH